MKLLMAIVRDEYAPDVNFALTSKGFSVTRISSTGGFWRRGNVTLLVGLDDMRVNEALEIIDKNAGPPVDSDSAPPSHPPHRATVFVLDTECFARY